MSFQWNPIAKPMQYANHSITKRKSYERELSNFKDQSISDRVQNLGNIIILWEESSGEFWVESNCKNYAIHQPLYYLTNFVRTWIVQFLVPINIWLSPKVGENHNVVGGVIWWVLSEIQSLELCNTPTTPFQNELRMNPNCPISRTNRYRIESKTWATS